MGNSFYNLHNIIKINKVFKKPGGRGLLLERVPKKNKKLHIFSF